ncbi:MAG TPA: DUF1579 family protein [Thermoanaerobaculia bacterium]|nr:DUF1579 family protein [Thermoanaerobaculia bacterium]
MKTLVLLLSLAVVPLPLPAQMPGSDATKAQREEMKKLDFLVGRWKGQGWVEMAPGKRETFTQTENVQSKVGGLALLVEGRGTSKLPGSDQEVTSFEAMGLLSWDEENRRYRFFSGTTLGRFGESEGRLVPGGFEWGFRTPQGGRVRYTIKLTEKGEWHEVGEFSRDGKTWQQFHEMTLQRVD